MKKMTFAQVDAMTNSELTEALEDLGGDPKETRRLTHAKKVAAFWEQLAMVGLQDVPVEKKAEEKASDAKVAKEATRADRELLPAKGAKECKCGCGGMTRGGTWLPGHDAKAHSASLGSKAKHAPKACRCGCGEMTRGGTFRPGHDAKYYSQLHKSAEIGLNMGAGHVGQPSFLPETLNPAEVALITAQAA